MVHRRFRRGKARQRHFILTCCHLFRACQQSNDLGFFWRDIYPPRIRRCQKGPSPLTDRHVACRESGRVFYSKRPGGKSSWSPMRKQFLREFNELSHYAAPSKIFPSLSMLTMMRRPSRKIIFSRSKLLRYSVTCWREAPTIPARTS